MSLFGIFQNPLSHSHLKIQDRLKVEALRRTNNGSIPQAFIAVVAWIYFAAHPEASPIYFYIGFGLIVGMQILRLTIYTTYQREFEKLLKFYDFMMALSIGTALLWSVLSGLAFQRYTLSSEQGIIFIFNLLSYMAGCTYSLASVPRIQKVFIVIVGIPLLIAGVFENSSFGWVCAIMFFPFLFYLFAISDNHAADLVHTYETEAHLRSEREKLRLVINSVPGFVGLADGTNQWVESSESLQSISNKQEIWGKLDEFRKSKKESHVEEIDWIQKGIVSSHLVSFARLPNSIESVLIIGVPIDELKAIRREIEVQRSKVEYASRLSTVGEMAGGIAHEVNTPLAVIVGATYQLRRVVEESLKDHPEADNLVHKIEVTAYRINTIIKSLQYFARQADEDPFEDIHIPMVVANALQLTQAKFAKFKVDLVISSIPDVTVPARPVQIAQVLIHLLTNAFDAALKSDTKRVELNFAKEEQGLVVAVTDSGAGISDQNIGRIFEPFFTTKEIGQGTGLGLPVSKGIIEDHQGRLTVESIPGRTTFRFFLPWKRT